MEITASDSVVSSLSSNGNRCAGNKNPVEKEKRETFTPKRYKQFLTRNRLKLYEEIGRGHSSIVFRCRKLYTCSRKNFALKVIRLDSTKFDLASMECSILRKLSHHNIVKCYNVFMIDNKTSDDYYYQYKLIQLEHLSCSLLDVYYSNYWLDDAQARRLFYQIGSAVRYLHQQSITHNDIKPANIMLNLLPYGKGLNHCTYKLIDFGYARQYQNTDMEMETLGDVIYLAPEKLNQNGYNPFLADSFNLALTIVESIDGIHERIVRSKSTIHSMVIQSYFQKLYTDSKISKSFCSIISQMLLQFERRLSIEKAMIKYHNEQTDDLFLD